MRGAGFLLSLFVLFLQAPAAHANDAVQQAQTIISSQIAAFVKEDAVTAYSFASPEIKARFPDPNQFYGMVRKTYAAVSQPGNYAFGRTKATDDGSRVFQEVLISDPKGQSWAAFYDVVRQADGSYVINGVRMARDTVNQGL